MTWRRGVFWALVALFLAPAVLLTVLRVSDPRHGLLIRAQSLAPLAILPYAVVLALLVAWSVRHRRQAWVLVVPLAGLALHLHWLAPLYTGATPPPNPDATPLVVMTVNLEAGRGDGVPVVQEALRHHADVLVLEDLSRSTLVSMDRAGLTQLFPHHVSAPGSGDNGTVVFSRTDLGDVVAEDPSYRSLMTTVHTADGPLRLYAVHPQPPTNAAAWRADHERLLAVATSQHPDLIVGDFNATLDQVPLRRLEDHGFRDAGELANDGWQPTWPSNGLYHVLGLVPIPPLVQIDHVMVGPGMAAIGSSTVHVDGTDHRALLATVAPE